MVTKSWLVVILKIIIKDWQQWVSKVDRQQSPKNKCWKYTGDGCQIAAIEGWLKTIVKKNSHQKSVVGSRWETVDEDVIEGWLATIVEVSQWPLSKNGRCKLINEGHQKMVIEIWSAMTFESGCQRLINNSYHENGNKKLVEFVEEF